MGDLRKLHTAAAAEPGASVSQTRTSPRAVELAAARSEAPGREDPAPQAIALALDREGALGRAEHSASLQRLRQALSIGAVLWPSTGLLDWWVVSFGGTGSLQQLLLLDGVGWVAGLFALWWVRRPVEPSPRALWWIDVSIFTFSSLIVSLMCASFGGIGSPYATGVIVILVARGATTLAPWQRGVWLFGIPASTFPLTMLVVSQFDEEIAAQLRDPVQLVRFVTSLWLLVLTWLLLTVGGHFAWRLRREALETRNIGRYKLERRLGSGGMGEVWAAHDLTLRHRVALKTVRGQAPGSLAVARLEREVRALAELTHPNTVRVFDYGVTDNGLWYYAMELLHGENLREVVTREGPMTASRLARIARQVLRALGEAHGKGIVHRDIKPENVFIATLGGEADVAKLLDFGIAKAMVSGDSTLTGIGWVAGTPAYMAPEVIRGGPADIRSDIYSFGAMLFFALTAKVPFQEEDPQAVFFAHLNKPPPLVSELSPAPVPAALEQLIQRCMAKDPRDRFASTQALLDELAQLSAEH
jgi:eukaryotic-like serine/threonine-protein kinase